MPVVEVKIPGDYSESTDVVILKCFFEEGDEVEEGQTILETETDKANIEIPSPVSGFISSMLVKEGEVVKPGNALALIETDLSLKPKTNRENKNGLLAVKLRLGVICEHCNHAIPVNGFMEEVKCNKCNETTELKGKLRWEEILNYQNPKKDIFKATKNHRPGEGDYGAWQPVKLKTWRNWPECKSCHHQLEQKDFDAANTNNGLLICPKCSAPRQLKPAPHYIKKTFPAVQYSLDKLPADMEHSGNSTKASNPVVMACMSCGGSLSVDGKSRLVLCTFCSSNNYLPDDLWFALHPQPKMEDWFIIFDSKQIK